MKTKKRKSATIPSLINDIIKAGYTITLSNGPALATRIDYTDKCNEAFREYAWLNYNVFGLHDVDFAVCLLRSLKSFNRDHIVGKD